MKASLVLLGQIQGKAQARRINPTLAHLGQAPYDVWVTQGVCDWRQAGRVGNLRETVAFLGKAETLLLGLRLRYRMSQRDVAKVFAINEGNVTRRTDKLRERCLTQIGARLVALGWTGDDLEGFILTEMGSLLLDDPRLSAAHLGSVLAARGKSLPKEVSE